MSTGDSFVVIGSGAIIVAAVWIGLTRRRHRSQPIEPIVTWLRPEDSGVRHAFWTVELNAEPSPAAAVEPVMHCGRWPAAELTGDDAPRCAPCERAVSRIEQHRQT